MRLDDLAQGMRVSGIVPGASVTVVAVERYGDGGPVLVTFRDPEGKTSERYLYPADEPSLELETAGSVLPFDGDGAELRLVTANVDAIREELERAAARCLQPHHIQAFFLEAFARLHGRVHQRERGRFEIARSIARGRADRGESTPADARIRFENPTPEKANPEIQIHVPGGVPEDIQRIVTENCRTLGFTDFGFEEE